MRNRSTLSLLIFTSMIALVLLAVLVYGVVAIRSKNQKTSELLLETDRLAEQTVLTQSLRAVRNSASEDISEFERLVLHESEIVSLIESIERAGRSMGLEVEMKSVDIKEEEKPTRASRNAETPSEPEPRKVTMTVETQGPRGGTIEFVRTLQTLPHRVMVDEMVLTEEAVGWRSRSKLSIFVF